MILLFQVYPLLTAASRVKGAMALPSYLLALDQGTTSSRAILFDQTGARVAMAQQPFPQHYPRPGWVEHAPMELLESQFSAAAACVAQSGVSSGDIAAVGVTNQRETAVIWEKATGKPIYNAIVWQCRRTAEACDRLSAEGMGSYVRDKTGLLIDAYFSGTKFQWMLDAVPGARRRAEKGELLCGTVDSWLIWNLTGRHVSDYSNCARTMLFDIGALRWDETLCRRLEIPMQMLPQPVPNSGDCFGSVKHGIPGLEALAGVPVRGAAGDQQAALFGQGCFTPGQAKNTYGTGCFTLMNVGGTPLRSSGGLVTSVGWNLGSDTTYVLEGSVFNAGSSIQWLRDELGLISSSSECDVLAESVPDNGGVYLVSAFTGLGAPHWDMYARGAVVGLTRGSTKAHLARATLEGIAYQVADLVDTMGHDVPGGVTELRVDGGACVSDFMMQFQSDLLGIPIDRPAMAETTALGAAFLAGLSAGVWGSTDALSALRKSERVFTPKKSREREFAVWHKAVERAKAWADEAQ